MRLGFMLLSAVALFVSAYAATAGEKSRFGTNVTEWSSTTAANPPVIKPIGGSGQVNGNFVTGERNGVEIGIRASRRFQQNINPLANARNNDVGEYQVET